MSIDGTVSFGFVGNDRRTVGLNTSANLPVNYQPAFVFSNGTGAGQGNILFQGTFNLSGGSALVDLYGVLKDSYGTLVDSLRIKAVLFQNNSVSNTQTFGAAATNPWTGLLNATGTFTLQPGDVAQFASGSATGYPIGSSTNNVLQVTGTGTDEFTLIFIGANA